MLTIAKLSRWSINYYNDTARAAGAGAADAQRGGGGLGEYYCEHDTRTPVWLCAGDTHTHRVGAQMLLDPTSRLFGEIRESPSVTRSEGAKHVDRIASEIH
jgi:hypothetical protein